MNLKAGRVVTSVAGFLAAVCFLALSMVGAASAGPYAPQKVVYDINYDDPVQQAGALRNIQNHINAVGADSLDLVVVLRGDGLALLLRSDSLTRTKNFDHANATEHMSAVDTLKRQGVSFKVCASTARGRNVNVETDLYGVTAEDIVPNGVAEVAKLQGEGYTYIKP